MLFSSSSTQKEILGGVEVFGARLAGRVTFPCGEIRTQEKPGKIIHFRIAVAQRVSLGGTLSKAEAVSIN